MSSIPHVVILGGGFGGLSAANEIRNSLDSSKVKITIIDKASNVYSFKLKDKIEVAKDIFDKIIELT